MREAIVALATSDRKGPSAAEALRPLFDRVYQGHCAIIEGSNKPVAVSRPLTFVNLGEHCRRGPVRFGAYPIAPGESTTRVAVLDFDSHQGEVPWPKMVEVARSIERVAVFDHGILFNPFRSTGGKGLHLIALWDEPQDAYSVRRALVECLAIEGLSDGTKGVIKGQVEVFPKQPEVAEDAWGNMFVLPLAGKSRWLDATWETSESTGFEWQISEPVAFVEKPQIVARPAASASGSYLAGMLEAIPVPDDYEQFRDAMFAVHSATGGSEEGFGLFDDWSAKGPKHNPDDNRRFWDGAGKRTEGPLITVEYLKGKAAFNGWLDPEILNGFDIYPPFTPEQEARHAEMFNRAEAAALRAVEKAKAKAVTYQEIDQGITDALAAGTPAVEVARQTAKTIAFADKLSPIEEKMAVKRLAKITGVSTRDALREIALARKVEGEAKLDIGLHIARKTLRLSFPQKRPLLQIEAGIYWRYDGTHWTQVAERTVAQAVHETTLQSWTWVESVSPGKKPPPLATVVADAMRHISPLTLKTGDPMRLMSRRPAVINTASGELWLEDDGPVLKPHSPDSYLTSCSDVAFDPEAKAPTFLALMRGLLSHPGGAPFEDQDEMLRHLLELMGYMVQPARFLKLFILIQGPGDNGKSQIPRVLRRLIGDDAIAFDKLAGADEGGSRFAAARLVGKLALIDDDVDHQYLLPDGFLKKIAEEKPLTAERKFQDAFTFIAQVVVMMLANSWPRLRDVSGGIQTRAQVIHLPRVFKKPTECAADDPDRQRPDLWQHVLDHEMPGVLNELVAAYYRVKARGGLDVPPSARLAFDRWFANANVVGRFLDVCTERTAADRPGPTVTEFAEAFHLWCEHDGVQQTHRPQKSALRDRLTDLGYRTGHTNRGTTVYGLRLKTDWRERPGSGFSPTDGSGDDLG